MLNTASNLTKLISSLRNRARGLQVNYLKAESRRRIKRTRPFFTDPQSPLEVHSLTSESDYLELLWCLKTFLHFSQVSCRIVIHDDGTLSEKAKSMLADHLMHVVIVTKLQADKISQDLLANKPACTAFRQQLPLARRLFDFPAFANSDFFMVLDSDVLFFSNPKSITAALRARRPFYMQDYQDGYVFTRDQIEKRFGVQIVSAFNTGISGFRTSLIDYELMEEYSDHIIAEGLEKTAWSEQTLFAILISMCPALPLRLPPTYSISQQEIGKDTIAHHFVNDGFRHRFYTKGIPLARRHGFPHTGMSSLFIHH